MRIILIIIVSSFFIFSVKAEDTKSNTYYFLFLSAKDDFSKKCLIDSTLNTLQPTVLEDLTFFEKNKMWEAGYHYISSFIKTNDTLNIPNTNNFKYRNDTENTMTNANGFSSNIILESGIDYSSQNFEILGFEGDSLISEKITTPNAGLRWNNQFKQKSYQVKNSTFLKNDKNYFTIDGFLKLDLHSKLIKNLSFKYYRLYDQQSTTYSFFQHQYAMQIGKNSKILDWTFSSDIRFKNYDTQTEYLKNYSYQNFNLFTSKFFNYWDISVYSNYLCLNRNETSEFDQEESIYFDLNYTNIRHKYQIEPEIRRYHYKHNLSDSLESNVYTDFSLNSNFKIPFNKSFSFCNYLELIDRRYDKQNENESNFIYFKLKPGINYEVNTNWNISVSAITEKEMHSNESEEYEIDNFYSLGCGVDIEMLAPFGFMILQYEFIHRNNDSFLSALSSFNHSANIHNINLSLNIRLSKNFSLSGLINYDYDKNWKEGNLNTSQLVSLQLSYRI